MDRIGEGPSLRGLEPLALSRAWSCPERALNNRSPNRLVPAASPSPRSA